MRIATRLLFLIAIVISAMWLYYDVSFESSLAFVVSLSAMLSTFFIWGIRQKQVVSKKSLGIQSGRDVVIKKNHRSSEESEK